VNALTNLHRVLRPGGLILDVQPDAVGHREVLVQIDGHETNVGTVSWKSEFLVSIQKARLVLDECVGMDSSGVATCKSSHSASITTPKNHGRSL